MQYIIYIVPRFGLYGLPLERQIFSVDVPELGRGSSTPVTYASVLAGDTSTPPVAKPDYQLKDLLNLPLDMGKCYTRLYQTLPIGEILARQNFNVKL